MPTNDEIEKKAWEKYQNTINLAWKEYMKAVDDFEDEKGFRAYRRVKNRAYKLYKKEIGEEFKRLIKV